MASFFSINPAKDSQKDDTSSPQTQAQAWTAMEKFCNETTFGAMAAEIDKRSPAKELTPALKAKILATQIIGLCLENFADDLQNFLEFFGEGSPLFLALTNEEEQDNTKINELKIAMAQFYDWLIHSKNNMPQSQETLQILSKTLKEKLQELYNKAIHAHHLIVDNDNQIQEEESSNDVSSQDSFSSAESESASESSQRDEEESFNAYSFNETYRNLKEQETAKTSPPSSGQITMQDATTEYTLTYTRNAEGEIDKIIVTRPKEQALHLGSGLNSIIPVQIGALLTTDQEVTQVAVKNALSEDYLGNGTFDALPATAHPQHEQQMALMYWEKIGVDKKDRKKLEGIIEHSANFTETEGALKITEKGSIKGTVATTTQHFISGIPLGKKEMTPPGSIDDKEGPKIELTTLLEKSLAIIEAVEQLSDGEPRILHGDIQPENILFINKTDEAPKCIFIDFGASCIIGTENSTKHNLGYTHGYSTKHLILGNIRDLINDTHYAQEIGITIPDGLEANSIYERIFEDDKLKENIEGLETYETQLIDALKENKLGSGGNNLSISDNRADLFAMGRVLRAMGLDEALESGASKQALHGQRIQIKGILKALDKIESPEAKADDTPLPDIEELRLQLSNAIKLLQQSKPTSPSSKT